MQAHFIFCSTQLCQKMEFYPRRHALDVSPSSLEQIGCIHICQGLEVDYIGVIMGPDLVIRNGQWMIQLTARASSDKSIHGLKSLLKTDPTKGHQMAELIIKNTYRTLMTRGMKGCFVWNSDEESLGWMSSILVRNGE